MLLRDDLRQLAALTAVGVTLGCAHLALRPGLPVFAAPAAAACTLTEPTSGAGSEPLESVVDAPMSVLPEDPP